MNTAMRSKKLRWPIDPDGYTIVRGQRVQGEAYEEPDPSEPFLVSNKYYNLQFSRSFNDLTREMAKEQISMLEDSWDRNRFYDPMECDNLFIRFSQITTAEELLSFANQFGNLGHKVVFAGEIEGERTRYSGYPIRTAVMQIEQYKKCFQHWVNLKKRANEIYDYVGYGLATIGADTLKDCFADVPEGQRKLAWAWAALGADVSVHLYDDIAFNVLINQKGDGLSLSFSPETLIGAIWLQFALTLTSNEQWKLCNYCGSPFKFKSSKREYCSESHRSLAFRKRQQKGEGKS